MQLKRADHVRMSRKGRRRLHWRSGHVARLAGTRSVLTPTSLQHDLFTVLNGPQLVLSAQFRLRTLFWFRPRACRTVFCRRGVSPSAPCGVVSCAYVCFKRRACARRKRRCVRLVRHGHSVCFGIPAQRLPHVVLRITAFADFLAWVTGVRPREQLDCTCPL